MPRFFTCHWQNRTWRADVNPEDGPVSCSMSNTFRQRGVSAGDVAYIVSLLEGFLYLGGRMTVERIVSRAEALTILKTRNLYDAREAILGRIGSGTPYNLHRRLAPELSRKLRFVSPRSEPKGLPFVSETRLDNQATRGVRELTAESAALLDQIIEITDTFPRTERIVTVTEEMLRDGGVPLEPTDPRLAHEIPDGASYPEGAVHRIFVNRYERDPRARAACIAHYGTSCHLCGFDFAKSYGTTAEGLIHVHHLKSLSIVGSEYEVDPIRDLRPVCPNCHAVVHRRDPPYSLDEVRQLLVKGRSANEKPSEPVLGANRAE